MASREVADLPRQTGLPLSWEYGRASALLAKSVFSASAKSRDAIHAVTGVLKIPVRPAIMPVTRNVHSTDEVLRCPTPSGWVNAGYKPYAKGRRHASVRGTDSPRPPIQGCQQRQSRGAAAELARWACSERQNLRVPWVPDRFMGPVSLTIAATKWPDGTSSRQPVGLLSNSPQQPVPAPMAVRQR
jgi:hypothetical protein